MRKKIMIVVMAVFMLLQGCKKNDADDIDDTTLEISTSTDSGIPYFIITTNLPDETLLEVKVKKVGKVNGKAAYVYAKEEIITVKNGKAQTGKYSDNGKSLDGYYSVCVSTLYMDEQPNSVREATEDGKNLKGDLVETNEFLDNVIYVSNSETYEFEYDEYASIDADEETATINEWLLSIGNETSKNNESSTDNMLQSELAGIEKNTNDALNKIIQIAKNNAEEVTDEQIDEAISKIRDNYPQYYNGPECMELYLYYGYLLDYAYDDSDPRSELGMDTYQAIKYVYRNVETVLDSSTKSNLEQIEKDLQKIK